MSPKIVPVARLTRRDPAPASDVDRRTFLGIGVAAAISSLALNGCVRKPKEKIVPFARRPEDLVPGKPRFYATNAFIAGTTLGLIVESQDGRPTKIEGNPKHPSSSGATSAFAQAEILELYDPDRAQKPSGRTGDVAWESAWDRIGALAKIGDSDGGSKLALLSEPLPSPTYERLLGLFRDRFPNAQVVIHDSALHNAQDGRALLGLDAVSFIHHYDKADVLVTLDADIFGVEPDSVRSSRLVANRRRIVTGTEDVGRHYAIEPSFTSTGACADNRLRLPASGVADFVVALLAELQNRGADLPSAAAALRPKLAAAKTDAYGPWIPALAKDLMAHRGKSLIVAGHRQPANVHAAVTLLNHVLGNMDRTITVAPASHLPSTVSLSALCKRIDDGGIEGMLIIGGNPAFDAPPDLAFGQLLERIPASVHLAAHRNETSALCSLHIPRSHFLEAWGDIRATDGVTGVQQPLIAPLYDTVSEIELIARLLTLPSTRGYEIVKRTWSDRFPSVDPGELDRRWRRWLHDGITDLEPALVSYEPAWDRLVADWPSSPAAQNGFEVDFELDAKVYDGRYGNNGWLQELPDPTTKLTWDNAAIIDSATAAALGVESGDMLRIESEGRALEVPAMIVPGTAEGTVVLAIGYGRKTGRVAAGAGFDANVLRTSASRWILAGASVRSTGRRHALATTQEHGSMEGRPILRQTTMEAYRRDPAAVSKTPGPPLKSLWNEPHPRGGQQWGMSIDLSSCTGCSACVVACQAENNVPVVGKDAVLKGREMHWLRLDRYIEGQGNGATMASQPMACTHCENAPCESVCPVAATVHSPEGLNDMAYNRCIGTRYCSNNCPLKVRRFNFFNYNDEIEAVQSLQKNPDVTVRFRGVMEKCTYCVQRINEQKIKAKREGSGVVPDGAIATACEQACPTRAIVFGDVNDGGSRVVAAKRQGRSYSVLAELNIKPRTTYLARIRNPNPELV